MTDIEKKIFNTMNILEQGMDAKKLKCYNYAIISALATQYGKGFYDLAPVEVYEMIKKYRQEHKEKNRKEIVVTQESLIDDAIKLLKMFDYKVFKPVTEYKEM